MMMKTRGALLLTILIWASAFVVMRAESVYYSAQGMVLLRFMVGSLCMGIVYYYLPDKRIQLKDAIGLMLLGGLSLGVHNLFLTYGASTMLSGVSSFVSSQTPILTAILAIIFLGEKLTAGRVIGFACCLIGTALMTMDDLGHLQLSNGMICLLIGVLAGSVFSLLQKPYLVKYHAIEATTYVIWGCTVFLLMYLPFLSHDVMLAPQRSTIGIIYLGIFPVAVAHSTWSYALRDIPASQAMNYLYLMPFMTTMMAWLWIGEMPRAITLGGGILAIMGVMIGSGSGIRLNHLLRPEYKYEKY